MPWAAVGGAVGGIAGGLFGGSSAKKAAKIQAKAAVDVAKIQAAQKQPYVDAGKEGLATLSAGLKPGGQFNRPFTMADATNSEAEKIAQARAKDAIANSAAAKGGYLSSNQIRDATDAAGAIGAQYQNQAFNQWLAQNTQTLGGVESLAGTGQTASTQVADATSGAALAGAGARAGSAVAQGNIWGGVAQDIGRTLGQVAGLSSIFNSGTPSTAGSGMTATPYTMADWNNAAAPSFSPPGGYSF